MLKCIFSWTAFSGSLIRLLQKHHIVYHNIHNLHLSVVFQETWKIGTGIVAQHFRWLPMTPVSNMGGESSPSWSTAAPVPHSSMPGRAAEYDPRICIHVGGQFEPLPSFEEWKSEGKCLFFSSSLFFHHPLPYSLPTPSLPLLLCNSAFQIDIVWETETRETDLPKKKKSV